MLMLHRLPRDVQLIIIGYMDIDGRRALGIYRRLRVPLHIETRLAQVLHKPCVINQGSSVCISLGRDKVTLLREFGTSIRRSWQDTFNSILGCSWYTTSVLDNHHERKNKTNPLQLEYAKIMSDDGIYYSIQSCQSKCHRKHPRARQPRM